jgi:hypothetical protein
MQPASRKYVGRIPGAAAAALSVFACMAAAAGQGMPAAQTNALVKKYCAVCHSDAQVNGGLSLDRFDAAQPDAALAAMLVSKLTNGLSPKQVEAARKDPALAASVLAKMKTGAMGAAGVPVPDRSTQEALLYALAEQAAGADQWAVHTGRGSGADAQLITASLVREAASVSAPGDTDLYRLTITCRPEAAEMLLTWSPGSPSAGQVMSVGLDEDRLYRYQVEAGEKKFKGAIGTMGTGGVILFAAKRTDTGPKLTAPLPEHTLTISNLFPGQSVVFPFDGLAPASRRAIVSCFAGVR